MICWLQETHFSFKTQTDSEGIEKDISSKWVALFVSDNVEFKLKMIKRHKEGHDRMIKGSVYQEYKTIINIYAANIGAHKHIKKIVIEVKGEINNIKIVGDFNTSFLTMDRSPDIGSIKKVDLNNIINQTDLTDTYWTFHLTIHIFLKCAQDSF